MSLRPTNDFMEQRLGNAVRVLDHGFIRLVDYMGDEAAIVQAARVSYGEGTKSYREDRGLLRYLMRHWHTTPFEMCEIKIHVKMPIFVARQWVRHRTASINEISARYSVLDNEFYVPASEDLAKQSTANHQGRDRVLTQVEATRVRDLITFHSNYAYNTYSTLLDGNQEDGEEHAGIARELARMGLSLNFYTQWYWKTDVKNLLDFIRLRADPHAQKEIRVYADVLSEWVRGWLPAVHEAFLDYRVEAATLPGPAVAALRELFAHLGLKSDTTLDHFRHILGLRMTKSEMEETFKTLGLDF